MSFFGGPTIVLPTEVPITFAGSSGGFGGDGMGPIYVSLDSPFATQPRGSLLDRVGTGNLAPLIVNGQVNPAPRPEVRPHRDPLAPITRLTILEEHRQTAPKRSVSFRLPVAPSHCHPQPPPRLGHASPGLAPEIEVPIP